MAAPNQARVGAPHRNVQCIEKFEPRDNYMCAVGHHILTNLNDHKLVAVRI